MDSITKLKQQAINNTVGMWIYGETDLDEDPYAQYN